MAVKKNHQALLRKLAKKVKLLQRKAGKSRNQLRLALKKAQKLGRSYKSKLASKARVMKAKVEQARVDAYAEAASHLERQLLKGVKKKAKALVSAASRIEKKYASKLAKTVAKKSKKTKKAVKKAKPVVKKKRMKKRRK